MKRVVMTLSLALAVLAGTVLAARADKAAEHGVKGQEITLTGRLSCTFCKFAHPEKPCPKACCASCIKAGDPALLTDGQGNMYVLLNNEMKRPLMNKERSRLAGGDVAVTGVLVKGQGVQVIFVESMKKA